MSLEIVVNRPSHGVATLGNVLLVAWRTKLDVAGAEDAQRALRLLRERHPQGIAVFSHVSATCAVPDAAAREALARNMRETLVVADAATFAGAGLRATLVRTTVTMLNLMSSKKTPSEVFGDVDLAATWLVTKGAPGRVEADAKALAEAMRALVSAENYSGIASPSP